MWRKAFIGFVALAVLSLGVVGYFGTDFARGAQAASSPSR